MSVNFRTSEVSTKNLLIKIVICNSIQYAKVRIWMLFALSNWSVSIDFPGNLTHVFRPNTWKSASLESTCVRKSTLFVRPLIAERKDSSSRWICGIALASSHWWCPGWRWNLIWVFSIFAWKTIGILEWVFGVGRVRTLSWMEILATKLLILQKMCIRRLSVQRGQMFYVIASNCVYIIAQL